MVIPSTPEGTFAGTVAVITGGASGIGQATAEAFIAAGARVVRRAGDVIPEVKEVVLALNATVDGQTTAHYITDLLRDTGVKVTRLAYGVPVGGELDYLDEGTLSAAIKQRTLF